MFTRLGFRAGFFYGPELDALKAAVAKVTDVEGSAKTLLVDLKTRLDAAIAKLAAQGADIAELQSISNDLGTGADDLAAAVVANTPAEG